MNKRIKELAEQAGFDITGKEYNINKFAESIVRECAEVAANRVVECEGVEFELTEACYKHFGVKE